ncbi:hypothetical protein DVH02_20845 [Streptomyces corynorhini]|uniref:Uncharacterized protein n=1 Tax=Streptomyces corynorhini TaxID=2282652 RepID=A0A370B369_9ACTN|nr:hypothetical protein DVH02_20845 [Streptomyces corynorhini]
MVPYPLHRRVGGVVLAARVRAGSAGEALGLRGGWGRLAEPGPEAFGDRFGQSPRPSQRMVMEAARRMETPGLPSRTSTQETAQNRRYDIPVPNPPTSASHSHPDPP